MNKSLIIILLILTSQINFAQDWSEPVLISTMQGYNDNPDFCIDNAGIIYCVWSHEITSNFRKIYYSKSQDQGETWSEPEDVSLNETLWMSNPHIVSDTENNLYLSYDYDTYNPSATLVLLKKFNGTTWSNADIVSTDMPGSYHSRLAIDNNNRVYIFWYISNKTYYKYKENDIYSEIFCPYNNGTQIGVKKIIADNNNNLHCSGSYDYEKAYFKYTYNTGWSDITYIAIDSYLVGQDIALDENQNPHFAFHTKTTETPPYNDATLYKYFTGTHWTEPEIIIEDPQYQTIAIDGNNHVHIVNREKTETGYHIVHYQKYQDSWEGIILSEETYAFWDLKLIFKNSTLFLIYTKIDEGGGDSEIIMRKLNIPLNIPENIIKTYYELKQNYPNPFKYKTIIHFELNKPGQTILKIFDLKGNLVKTLINEYIQNGEYNISWDGTNQNNKKVPAGLYLYRLQVNKRIKTRSLIIN